VTTVIPSSISFPARSTPRKRRVARNVKKPNYRGRVSVFAVTGRAKEGGDMEDLPFDEGQMEKAMQMLAGEAEKINEDDPRQAAQLMRKLSSMTGLDLGDGMEEALSRMEQGEDPEQIEADMGDLLEGEDPFNFKNKKGRLAAIRQRAPFRDETLYDL
jgi:cytochrome c556